VVHHSAALTRESGDGALAEAVASLEDSAKLSGRLSVLLRYAVKLTREPSAMLESDLGPLRESGLTDRDIVDLNQVVAYFNYVNRIAHGLGVELEPRWTEGHPT